MDNVTHSLCGVLVERWICPDHHPKCGFRRSLVSVVAANLPDLDLLFRLKGPDAYIFFHRGLSHSLLVLLVVPPVLALVLKRWLDLSYRTCWLLVVVSLGSHLCLDVLTSWGTELLAPFSSARFALNWVFIVDPVILLCLSLGMAFGRRTGRRFRDRKKGAQWGFGLLALYLITAAVGHEMAVRQIRNDVTKKVSLPSVGRPFTSVYRPGPTQVDPHLQVEAIPAPLAPMLWNGLAATDTGYIYHYTINTLQGGTELKAVVALGLENPLASEFFRTDEGRHYLLWARSPRVQQLSPDRILLEDLRYNFAGLESMARPGVMEVNRQADGTLIHQWLSIPLPK